MMKKKVWLIRRVVAILMIWVQNYRERVQGSGLPPSPYGLRVTE